MRYIVSEPYRRHIGIISEPYRNHSEVSYTLLHTLGWGFEECWEEGRRGIDGAVLGAGSAFLVVVDFVVFAFFVFALLNEVAVAVDVDMEISVEFDDAFVGPRLFFYGSFADVEAVL